MTPNRLTIAVISALCLAAPARHAAAQNNDTPRPKHDLAAALAKNHWDDALYAIDEGADFVIASSLDEPKSAAEFALFIANHLNAFYIDGPFPPRDRTKLPPAFEWFVRKGVSGAAVPARTRDSLLLAAAELGDLDAARYLVAVGADVNYRTPIIAVGTRLLGVGPIKEPRGGETPLFLAARGYYDWMHNAAPPDPDPVVAFLLAHGADANAASARGDTSLMRATAAGKPQTVRRLLAVGADPNRRDDAGMSALSFAIADWLTPAEEAPLIRLLAPVTMTDVFEAARLNDAARVQELLRAGADPNARRSDGGETALAGAAWKDAVDAARVLLDSGAAVGAVDNRGRNILYLAAEAGSEQAAAALLDYGADPNRKESYTRYKNQVSTLETPLVHAVSLGHVGVVELFLRRSASLSINDQHDDAARQFVEYFAGVSRLKREDPAQARRQRAAANRARMLELLAAHGLDYKDGTIAVYAACSGEVELLRTCLERGASPNARHAGETPGEEAPALMGAISCAGNARFERSLDPADEAGAEAANLEAVEQGGKACLRLLLARGADANVASSSGVTPLMQALSFAVPTSDLADILLKHRARINTVDKEGRTALMRAMREKGGNAEAVRYLLAHHASPTPQPPPSSE